MTEQGIKHDQDKIRHDLITIEMLDALAERLTLGAIKYSDRNWERGIHYSRLYRGALSHLTKWFHGEDEDPEDGGSHLDAAFACIGFLVTETRRPELARFDNRPVRSAPRADQVHWTHFGYHYVGSKEEVPHGARDGDNRWCKRCKKFVYGNEWPLHIEHVFSPVDLVENGPAADLSTAEKPPVSIKRESKVHLATENGWGRCGVGIRFRPILDTESSDKVTCQSCIRLMS